jgi:CIC family chloride channel protein
VHIKKIWNEKILKYLLKNSVQEERTYFALTIIVGLSAALVAVSIHQITHYLVDLFGTNKPFDLKALILGGIAIFTSGYISTRKFPGTSGSGIPGVRVALAVYHGKITILQTMAKYVTSVLSLSTGLSLGREGPTAAISAGIGSYVGQLFHLSKRKVKALVAIGVAGGIAAAFNTPIAAVVFTLEEVVGDLNAKILGNIIVSSIVAAVTAHFLLGNNPTFQTLNFSIGHPSELTLYALVGIASALLGPFWTKSVLWLRSLNLKVFRGHKLSIIMITFLIMAIISYVRPEALGGGHGTIESTLLTMKDSKILLSLFVFKFIATTICYGSGVSGGLFLPTLLMGATLGSFLGSIFTELIPGLEPNLAIFALVGMGSYFAAVIRAPFTSIIMVFEMTRDYDIIMPLMLANIISYFLSSKINSKSIYESISEQDGIHLPNREDHEILENSLIEDAMNTSPVSISSNLNIKEAVALIKENQFSGFPILTNGMLTGVVSRSDLNRHLAKGDGDLNILEIAEKKIITIYPDQSLLVAFHKLNRFHVSRLPVVSRINEKKLIGIITAENIVSLYGYNIENNPNAE